MLTEEEKDRLIARFFSGEAKPEEAMQLEDWANVSAENRKQLNSCAVLFANNSNTITASDQQQVWQAISESFVHKPQRRFMYSPSMKIAAAIGLISLLLYIINMSFKRSSSSVTYMAEARAENITLKDNSKITLLPHSSIIINTNNDETNSSLKLRGSAIFSIIHDSTRELIVDVNHLHIKDTGTRFSVRSSATNDTIAVSVIEGSVFISDDGGLTASANAGEKFLYVHSRKVFNKITADFSLEDSTPGGKPVNRTNKKKSGTTDAIKTQLDKKD